MCCTCGPPRLQAAHISRRASPELRGLDASMQSATISVDVLGALGPSLLQELPQGVRAALAAGALGGFTVQVRTLHGMACMLCS